MRRLRTRAYIYRSRRHRIATVLFVALPFIFFVLFAKFTAISGADLLRNIGISFMRVFIAYVIALIIAWICAVLFYRGKRAVVALPLFDVFQSFPTFAALPIAVSLWGVSHGATIIFFLVITIVWPIFFSIINSLHMIRHDWQDAVDISQLSGFHYLKLFLFPITIPGIVTGSIIGLGEGWEAMVATEIIVEARSGLGNFFNMFARDTVMTTFGILGFLILIFSINKLIWTPLFEWSHRKMEE